MVILKKIKGSTLMETLVATVLIIIIFMVASTILNNIFSNSIKSDTNAIDMHLTELRYLEINNKIDLPYKESLGDWDIIIDSFRENITTIIEFEANNIKTNKTILKQYIDTK
ncbi:hypothetical protein [Pontimicrobium sp. MEBiC01747]